MSVSPLAGLSQLTALYLGDNDIEDISSLSEIRMLGNLNIGGNRIDDISLLRGLPS